MELLSADMFEREAGERVFRHGLAGPMVMWALFVLPVPLAIHARAELALLARSIPWPAWIVVAPVALACVALWLLCLHAIGQVAYRAMLPSNWLMRVSRSGLALNLRSFQNAHFPNDGPTVVRLSWPEVARARKVLERSTRRGKGSVTLERKSWLELELAGVDTVELERPIAVERDRPGPERSFLGIRGRSRSNHVPVFVERPGVLRIEWVGGDPLRALGQHVEVGPKLTLDLDRRSGDLEARLRGLLVRGDRLAAVELVRNELGLSLSDARRRVEELEHKAA